MIDLKNPELLVFEKFSSHSTSKEKIIDSPFKVHAINFKVREIEVQAQAVWQLETGLWLYIFSILVEWQVLLYDTTLTLMAYSKWIIIDQFRTVKLLARTNLLKNIFRREKETLRGRVKFSKRSSHFSRCEWNGACSEIFPQAIMYNAYNVQ